MVEIKYKHLPHRLKKRILKKASKLNDVVMFGGYKNTYQSYIDFQKLVIKVAKRCSREEAILLRKFPRRRSALASSFSYSGDIDDMAIWVLCEEGNMFWFDLYSKLKSTEVSENE